MAGIKMPISDILTQLATIQTTVNGSLVNLYARIWNNQLRSEHNGKLYDFQKPAAFVEVIAPVQFQEIGMNFRSADLGINIHIVHDFYNADGTMDENLTVFDIRDQVVRTLSQFKPSGCGLMVSVNESQDFDHDNLYHYIVGFMTNFTDSIASPYDPNNSKYEDSTPPTNLNLNINYTNPPTSTPVTAQQPQTYNIPH